MEPPVQHAETEHNGSPSPGRSGPFVERLTDSTRGLVEDVKEWVELRIQLFQLEVEERIEAKLNQGVLAGTVALVLLLAVVFGLTALALGLGTWLGHPAWGFLAVAVLLGIGAAGLWAVRPRLVGRAPAKPRTGSERPEPPRLKAADRNALTPPSDAS